MQNVLWEI
ncbi:Protein of unknown function [Bacillus thuringiensis]|uniref:Uncharacterized protein n=1 Tax=Bacillus thuringiensis TaxID=1428 RepID=A0A1C4DDE2_BACTU|nr:Protein of unknown function [Bacillus thuringiensis]